MFSIKIAPVRLPNGKLVYMEVDEDVKLAHSALESSFEPQPPGRPAGARGGLVQKGMDDIKEMAVDRVRDLNELMEGIAGVIPAAFQHAADVKIEKLTLSFGIKLGGEAGIPYLTKGKAEGNLSIQVECCYPEPPGAEETAD